MYTSCSTHVFQLPLASPTLKPATTTNTYLIHSQDQVMVVDPGFDHPDNTQAIIQAIHTLGNPTVAGVIFTHYHKDHSPGARGLAKLYSCPLYCHEREVDELEKTICPLTVARTLKDNERVRIGEIDVRVIHTPGHTAGHIALYVEDDAVLLTGDTVISQGSTWIGPPDGHMATYLQSLRHLKQFPASLIGPGHGPIIHEPQQAIDWFLSRRLERERQILSMLSTEQPVSVEQLVADIYAGQVDPDIIWVAEKTVLAHLIKLVEDGEAVETTDGQQAADRNRAFLIRGA